MRIVSLLPSATEIVCALGLEDELVGVTHECDWPPEVVGKPVLTRSVHDLAGTSSREIHRLVGDAVHGGSSLYALDEDALEAADPDLILTQELCDVCAVSYREVNEVARAIDAAITVVSLEPTIDRGHPEHDLDRRRDDRRRGRRRRARRDASGRGSAIDRDEGRRAAQGRVTSAPRVVGLEWLDPPFAVGHWVPEQIQRAGGWDLLGQDGERSVQTDWLRGRRGRPRDARR